MRSGIRVRITAIAVLVVAFTLAIAALLLVQWQRQALTESLDERLSDRADVVEAQVASGVDSPTLAGASVEAFAQLVDPDGNVIAGTPGLETEALGLPPAAAADTYATVHSLPVDDDTFRVLTRSLPEGTLYVGTTYDVVGESSAALVQALAWALPVVLVALGLIVWWLVGRTLQPVEAMRVEVAEIGAGELDRRVPEPVTNDEIGRLARTMNQMLDRLQRSASRQRQFTGDAAHELRSPLARMRVALEVERASVDDSWRQTAETVLEDVRDMEHLVDDLLYLARTDDDPSAAQRAPLDLDDVVLRELNRLTPVDGVTIDATGVSGAHVRGDAPTLSRLVRNLLDNATRHAASTVTVTLVEREDTAMLTVADDGPGIPDADRDRVFERFSRVDTARGEDSGGAGLGLAIARGIAEQHGGRLELAPSAAGAVFEFTVPTADGRRPVT